MTAYFTQAQTDRTSIWRKSKSMLLAASSLTALAMPAVSLAQDSSSDMPNVQTSILPLQSIAAFVMQGVGTPDVIVSGANSPHGFSLRPSQARGLQDADLVIWIGPDLELFLEAYHESIPADRLMQLDQVHGIDLIHTDHAHNHAHDDGHDHEEMHEEEHEEEHEHAEHEEEHDHADEHDHEDEHHADEHERDEHSEDDHDEHDEHHEDDGEFLDPHIWLSPNNAALFAHEIGERLSEVDPDNAETYAQNAQQFETRIVELNAEIEDILAQTDILPPIMFHDAFAYFQQQFDAQLSGTLTVNPEVAPGAKTLSDLREKIEHGEVNCVLVEPQFDADYFTALIEGQNITVGTIDPLGSAHEQGPELYFELLIDAANAFAHCSAS